MIRYKVVATRKMRKQLKLIKRRQKNPDKMDAVVEILASGEQLPAKYHDHALSDSRKYKDCRECHIEPDWLLVYRIDHGELILILVETGSHSDLF